MARKKKERKVSAPDLHLNEAKIEMLSNREIIVDGCKGIVEYGENFIKINIGELTLDVVGLDLVIESFDGGVAIIRGKFTEINFFS
ncbi:MAG: YabP/YqfC family sporulation protein [Clostridia bacterium]|nr:YabP/YqfC family sporulation protein [Clostridia bacterium]